MKENLNKLFEQVLFNEMNINGKLKPFKRYGGPAEYDSNGHKIKKTAIWEKPLDSFAYDMSPWKLKPGDFIYNTNKDCWCEVIDTCPNDEGRDLYLMPVDDCGNKLTKTKMKHLPEYAENEHNLERGYLYWLWIDDRSEDYTCVKTSERWDSEEREPSEPGEEYFIHRDENGRFIPTEKYMTEHPDYDIDTNKLYGTDGEGEYIPRGGSKAARDNYNKFKKADKEGAQRYNNFMDSNTIKDEMYSSFNHTYGGFSTEFDELQSNMSPENLKKLKDMLCDNTDYSHEAEEYPTKADIRRFCQKNNGNYYAALKYMDDVYGARAEAYSNMY